MFFLKKMPGNIAQIVFVVATFSYKSLKVTHNSLKWKYDDQGKNLKYVAKMSTNISYLVNCPVKSFIIGLDLYREGLNIKPDQTS